MDRGLNDASERDKQGRLLLSQRLRGISFHSNLIKSRRFPRNSAPDATESDLLHPHLHISSTSFALSLTNRGGISPTLVPFPGTIANFSSYRHPSRGVSQPTIIITTTHIPVTASTRRTVLLRSPTGASFIPPYGAAWGLGCNQPVDQSHADYRFPSPEAEQRVGCGSLIGPIHTGPVASPDRHPEVLEIFGSLATLPSGD